MTSSSGAAAARMLLGPGIRACWVLVGVFPGSSVLGGRV